MKKLLFSANLFFISIAALSQNWKWVAGPDTVDAPAIYGTQGVPAAGNTPGERHGGATWKDALGNLWLFGGECHLGGGGWRNDLWRFDATTNQWTWMRGAQTFNSMGSYGTLGTASALNDPPAREFPFFWTDIFGKFWLYGGLGPATTTAPVTLGVRADLWMFDPATNLWTWVSGSNQVDQLGIYGTIGVQTAGSFPGSRFAGATWVDNSGKLWLFGGEGRGTSNQNGRLDDVWRYDPAMNLWTWMHGTSTINNTAIYGILGAPSPANKPGAASQLGYWKDAQGNFWIFGGLGFNATTLGRKNDLWKYNMGANTWTWMGGPATTNSFGHYGTFGVPSATNIPGARHSPACWVDKMGDFYLFGGHGYKSAAHTSTINISGALNDVFRYKPATGEWTWIKGSDTLLSPGNYGTIGVTLPSNTPGARFFNTWWSEMGEHFWLFGGQGFDIHGDHIENLSDVWKFKPPCSPDSATSVTGTLICSGSQATLTAHNQLPSTVNWFNQPFTGPSLGTGSVYITPVLNAVGSSSVYNYFAEANSCTAVPRAMISISVNPNPTVQIVGTETVCAETSFTLSASGASTYSWSTGGVSATTTVTAMSPSMQVVVVGFEDGCSTSATTSIAVSPAPGVPIVSTASVLCTGSSATITVNGNDSYVWDSGVFGPSITVTPTISTSYTVTATNEAACKKTASITQLVSECVGLSNRNSAEWRVFPNPNKGDLRVSGPANTTVRLTLFNTLGQKVLNTSLQVDERLKISLPPGVYVFELRADDTISQGRLIME